MTVKERLDDLIETNIEKCNEDHPFCAFIYDLKLLKEHAASMMDSLPGYCELFYAMKANPDERILKVLDGIIDGFEAASAKEIESATRSTNKPIIFGCPAKKDYEIQTILNGTIKYTNIESLHEANRLQYAAEKAGKIIPVLIRVNLQEIVSDSRLKMSGVPTQFGMDEQKLPCLLERLDDFPNLFVKGFHFHAMSNNLDASNHLKFIETCLYKTIAWKQAYGLDVSVVNAGGGIGINYSNPEKPFEWDRFTEGLHTLKTEFVKNDLSLLLEVGRYLVAEAGYYAAEVIDIKENHGQWFALVRGGSHHFRLPAAWKMSHPFRILASEKWDYPFERPCLRNNKITITGELCTPNDVLAREVKVESLRAGDIVVFQYAGAYGWTISHHDFLSHPHPAVYYEE